MVASLERTAPLSTRESGIVPAPISVMALSDRRARFLLSAVEERSALIVGQSGKQVHVFCKRTDYVIPGMLMAITDGAHSNRVWIGINEGRLFYIQQFRLDLSNVEKLFQFCFGGAAKVGWAFNFEPIGDEDVSVWGTVWPDDSFTEATGSTVREESGIVVPLLQLTPCGNFWVNDLALMIQSSFRVAQRHGVPDGGSPCPL